VLLHSGKAAGGVKLTVHIHLLPRLRLRGTIPPFPQHVFMAWRLVKPRDTFTSIIVKYLPICFTVPPTDVLTLEKNP